MKILVINGPNMNMLGKREPNIYGYETYDDLVNFIAEVCEAEAVEVKCFQSNYEGAIIDAIHGAMDEMDGIVINPAGYTPTSVAILDALKCVALPAVEVHITDMYKREYFRHFSYPGLACIETIVGQGFEGYRKAILRLKKEVLT